LDLTRTLLEWLMINGPATLGLVAFVCALGVPLPVPVLMIAAGALVRQGHMHLPTAVAVTAGGALMAELLYYGIGRKLGPLARTRGGARFASAYDVAESRFRRRPSLTVYLTRWLFAPIGVPINLIAGSSRFPIGRFVAGAVIGNIMWIAGYTALGYALGSEWQNLSPALDRYKVYFAGAALLIGLGILAWRKRDVIAPAVRPALIAASTSLVPKKPEAKPVPISETKHGPQR
jgi:membrane-associated protein